MKGTQARKIHHKKTIELTVKKILNKTIVKLHQHIKSSKHHNYVEFITNKFSKDVYGLVDSNLQNILENN